MERIGRKHLEMALRASGTGVWLWLVLEKKAIFCEVTRRMFLADDEEVDDKDLTRRFLSAVHPDDVQRVKQCMIDAANLGTPYNIQYRLYHSDGRLRHIEAVGEPVFDDFGKATSVQGVCKDVTNEKLQQEQMQRLLLLEERQEFAEMLAHDLRLPIQSTQLILPTIIDSLQKNDHKVRCGELLSKIRSGNDGLLLMIDNLIDVYRVDSNTQRIRLANFNLKDLVQESVDEFAPIAALSELTLRVNLGNLSDARGDRHALKRVLANLLSNAVKFNCPGGTITIDGYSRENEARVSIADTGCGINEQDLDGLFDKYWRSEKKYRGIGMGMGLYLCKKLLQMQNGSISCESQRGKGSSFHISLPRVNFMPISRVEAPLNRQK